MLCRLIWKIKYHWNIKSQLQILFVNFGCESPLYIFNSTYSCMLNEGIVKTNYYYKHYYYYTVKTLIIIITKHIWVGKKVMSYF